MEEKQSLQISFKELRPLKNLLSHQRRVFDFSDLSFMYNMNRVNILIKLKDVVYRVLTYVFGSFQLFFCVTNTGD